ncbi:MAG: COX15/CtaA family protein [Candidatus Phosphoribacter sp.]
MALPPVKQSWVRPILAANLVAQVLIIVTGGVVRLTGSGLGCPDWPTCAEGSLVPVAAQAEGIHKFIEFGNRSLTGVLVVLALLSLWAVKTRYPHRRRLHLLGWALIVGILAQAVVGGITVWTGLNPVIVAFHFLASILLVAVATAMVRGAQDGDEPVGGRTLLVPGLTARLAWVTYAVGGLVIVLGTVVTGSGPHSGDADTPARTGFDPRTVSWLHADVVMLFIGLLVAVLVAVRLARAHADARPGGGAALAIPGELARLNRSWTAVLYLSLVQGFVGYLQFFTGLPVAFVALHMLGAALLAVILTLGMLNLYRNPVAAPTGA